MQTLNAPDIFISYAHVDNSTEDRTIDRFIKQLEPEINKQLGRASAHRIWKDNRLEGNQSVTPEIHQKLQQANCLLLFLSPSYMQSKWCLEELEIFYEHNQHQPERIFFVELDAFPKQDRPQALQDKTGYRFWYEDPLSKDTFPQETEDKEYKQTFLKLAKAIANQIKHADEFKQKIQQAMQASRNDAFEDALTRWKEIQTIQPDHPKIKEEIAALEERQKQQKQIDDLGNQLFARMQEIAPVFMEVATLLKKAENDTQTTTIIQLSQQFLDKQITAETYIEKCEQTLHNQTSNDTSNNIDYPRLAKRIIDGNTVLFLGSDLPGEYGETIADENTLAKRLADSVGYEAFNGSFSSIAEYYQLRPEYGRNELLDNVAKSLFNKPTVINFYQLLARIERPLVLVVSTYDCTLENIFKQYNKPYVVLSSIITESHNYKVGHVLLEYSDNREPENTWLEEDLSQLKLYEEGYSIIYKIKGSCEKGSQTSPLQKDALLLSESNFFTFARNADKVIPGYLVKHFQDRSFMFLGFNPKQWEDRLLVNALLEKRRYITTPCYTAGTSQDPLEAAYWDNQQVKQYDISLTQLDDHIEEIMS